MGLESREVLGVSSLILSKEWRKLRPPIIK
jgi:hypothetical protein